MEQSKFRKHDFRLCDAHCAARDEEYVRRWGWQNRPNIYLIDSFKMVLHQEYSSEYIASIIIASGRIEKSEEQQFC